MNDELALLAASIESPEVKELLKASFTEALTEVRSKYLDMKAERDQLVKRVEELSASLVAIRDLVNQSAWHTSE